jgi:hypothetical protein
MGGEWRYVSTRFNLGVWRRWPSTFTNALRLPCPRRKSFQYSLNRDCMDVVARGRSAPTVSACNRTAGSLGTLPTEPSRLSVSRKTLRYDANSPKLSQNGETVFVGGSRCTAAINCWLKRPRNADRKKIELLTSKSRYVIQTDTRFKIEMGVIMRNKWTKLTDTSGPLTDLQTQISCRWHSCKCPPNVSYTLRSPKGSLRSAAETASTWVMQQLFPKPYQILLG